MEDIGQYTHIKNKSPFLKTVCNDIYVKRENYTFIAKGPHYIAPPVLQLQPCVFHGLIFWDVAHVQHTTVETLFIHVSLGGSKQQTWRRKQTNVVCSRVPRVSAIACGVLPSSPGAGQSLELDQVDLRELLGGVFVQRPVLLHGSVQRAQLDEFGHDPDGWHPLDHQVPRFQVDGVHLSNENDAIGSAPYDRLCFKSATRCDISFWV